jgi:hypothetical protein
MTNALPAHLSAGIAERIAVLRQAWRVDEVFRPSQSRPRSHQVTRRKPEPPTSPTFPRPRHHDARSVSARPYGNHETSTS